MWYGGRYVAIDWLKSWVVRDEDRKPWIKKWDRWLVQKKQLNKRGVRRWFKSGEVWWVSVGVNIGFEIDGKGRDFSRPVLILKKDRRMFLGIPLTGTTRNIASHYTLKNDSLVFSQARWFDINRLLRKKEKISEKKLLKIKKAFITYLDTQ